MKPLMKPTAKKLEEFILVAHFLKYRFCFSEQSPRFSKQVQINIKDGTVTDIFKLILPSTFQPRASL